MAASIDVESSGITTTAIRRAAVTIRRRPIGEHQQSAVGVIGILARCAIAIEPASASTLDIAMFDAPWSR